MLVVDRMTRFSAVFALSVCLLAAGACDSTPTTPTPTGPTITSATQVFFGTLVPGGSPMHSFSTPSTQSMHVTLGSLTNESGLPLGSTVTLKLGIESQATAGVCNALVSVPAAAALKSQIAVLLSPGQYCVSITDTAGIPVGANYAVRLIFGTPTDATSSGTIPYSSTVLPTGYTARSFHASAGGVATITMESISPASVSALGLGLGFQLNDGSGCEVAAVVTAARGTEFSMPIDAGKYCVKVFDPGTLTETTSFTLRIQHP